MFSILVEQVEMVNVHQLYCYMQANYRHCDPNIINYCISESCQRDNFYKKTSVLINILLVLLKASNVVIIVLLPVIVCPVLIITDKWN